ncbi:hypothetical protein FVE85_0812 [Porphyridium purpureum]|uniref:Leishmanolysin-like peptidase n=1 Tax=Porphyridium purpureum TaxID=35688 RepID=A0A5J4Z2E3_PORPP|nr:hypothetical protein FVE85_0812 [Porphyridium purpureum]|eukprot:POR3296..scf208_2
MAFRARLLTLLLCVVLICALTPEVHAKRWGCTDTESNASADAESNASADAKSNASADAESNASADAESNAIPTSAAAVCDADCYPFTINLIPNGAQDPRAVQVFELALAKLQTIVLGQRLVAAPVTLSMYYRLNGLDGRGGVVGRAQNYQYVEVCTNAEPTCNYDVLPTLGEMVFDSTDFLFGTEYPAWTEFWIHVTLHEMLHLLGVGSFWINRFPTRAGYNTRVDCVAGSYAQYKYPAATREWRTLGGAGTPPVEYRASSSGTDCTHWREEAMRHELLTGSVDTVFSSSTQDILDKLSTVTLGAMEDLNYVVDWNRADQYTLSQTRRSVSREQGEQEEQGWTILQEAFAAGRGIQQLVQHGPGYVPPLLDRAGNVLESGSEW